VKTYSSGMRARLAFALSLAIEFDCFLIDEVVAVGDARFQQKCRDELFGTRGDRAMLIVSHDESYIREHCSVAAILTDGILSPVGPVEETLERYRSN
jgi:capsular polysaccharide transport system ATP-binding protein